MAPMPCILSDDSSESEGIAVGAGSASTSASEDTLSVRVDRFAKARNLEESEAESNGRPLSEQFHGPEAAMPPPQAEDAGKRGFLNESFYLGESSLNFCFFGYSAYRLLFIF